MNTENEICRKENDSEKNNRIERFKPHYTSEYSEEAWEVTVALPGVAKTDVDVTIEDEILEVTGLRKTSHPESWKRLSGYDSDRRYELRLDVGPEVDGSKIEASLQDGELLLQLPLKEAAKPLSIPVS